MSKMIDAIRNSADINTIVDLADEDLMKVDEQGQTGLMIAIQLGNAEAAEFLISEAGRFDKSNKNAYMYAKEMQMQTVVQLIEEQYYSEEVDAKIPGTDDTVWTVVKTQERPAVVKMAIDPFQNVGAFGADPFSFNPEMDYNLSNIEAPPPGIIAPQSQQVGQQICTPTVNLQKFSIVQELAHLSVQQLLQFQQADYFFQAILAGVGSQQVIVALKSVLDQDIRKCLCKRYTIQPSVLNQLLG